MQNGSRDISIQHKMLKINYY